MAKTTIVSYGHLQTFDSPPDSLVRTGPDAPKSVRIRARVFYIPGHPNDVAAVDVDDRNAPVAHGQLLTLDDSELPELDRLERHADFERVPVSTPLGQSQLYGWKRPILPSGAAPIESWQGPERIFGRPTDARDLEWMDRSHQGRLAKALSARRG